jgi:hypothetical protein
VVIAALTPILIDSYGAASHELWLMCSFLALVLFAVMLVVNSLAPENLAEVAAARATTPMATRVLLFGPTIWMPVAVLALALALVILDLFPDQEQALYLTAVGAGLFMSAMGLFVMIFVPGTSPTASDPATIPATGGSSV